MVTELAHLGAKRPVAIVTGGAKRVGAATCRALASSGFDIVLTYRSSKDAAVEHARKLEQSGVLACAIPLNLNQHESVESFLGDTFQNLPRLDVLVHNASQYEPTPIDSLTAESLESHARVNALAPALISAQLAPKLSTSDLPGGGAIVAMCDIHAMGRPRKDFLAYAISKAAITEMVRTLARELAPHVRVNGVAPGVVAFPESGYESDPEMQRQYLSRVPLERSGTPEDAAEVVRWLAVDATYITGEIIRVDGGRWLR